MFNYKSPTHVNLAVWSRRLGIEILNIENAAEMANTIFGSPSRRGVLAVFAMKFIATHTGEGNKSPTSVICGCAIASVLYDAMYGKQVYTCPSEGFRLELDKMVAAKLCTREMADYYYANLGVKAMEFIGIAKHARIMERKAPSITNQIIAKALRG